jgi:hypothetical protein
MALRLGTENKRQVYLLVALVVVILLVGGYELKQNFASSPAPSSYPAAVAAPATAKPVAGREAGATPAAAGGKEARKLSNDGIDPALHLDKLNLSESVAYVGTGRNIFAGEPIGAPVRIETPAKGPRPGQNIVKMPPPLPPGPPRPPAIDLKYFGYAQARDKSLQAFFVHGDDIFIARQGEIVNHRYKVDAIFPGSVRITDLSYNNTQSLPLTAN